MYVLCDHLSGSYIFLFSYPAFCYATPFVFFRCLNYSFFSFLPARLPHSSLQVFILVFVFFIFARRSHSSFSGSYIPLSFPFFLLGYPIRPFLISSNIHPFFRIISSRSFSFPCSRLHSVHSIYSYFSPFYQFCSRVCPIILVIYSS